VLQQPGIQVPVAVSKPVLPAGRCLDCYRQQEGGPVLSRFNNVRLELPVRTAHFHQVLPHVTGFPHLRVPCLRRHPGGTLRALPLTVLLRLPGSKAPQNGQVRA